MEPTKEDDDLKLIPVIHTLVANKEFACQSYYRKMLQNAPGSAGYDAEKGDSRIRDSRLWACGSILPGIPFTFAL